MAQRWAYRRCGTVHGPLGLDDLRAAAFLGFLRPDDLVRDLATDQWVTARSVEPLRIAFLRGPESERPPQGNSAAPR